MYKNTLGITQSNSTELALLELGSPSLFTINFYISNRSQPSSAMAPPILWALFSCRDFPSNCSSNPFSPVMKGPVLPSLNSAPHFMSPTAFELQEWPDKRIRGNCQQQPPSLWGSCCVWRSSYLTHIHSESSLSFRAGVYTLSSLLRRLFRSPVQKLRQTESASPFIQQPLSRVKDSSRLQAKIWSPFTGSFLPPLLVIYLHHPLSEHGGLVNAASSWHGDMAAVNVPIRDSDTDHDKEGKESQLMVIDSGLQGGEGLPLVLAFLMFSRMLSDQALLYAPASSIRIFSHSLRQTEILPTPPPASPNSRGPLTYM